MFGPVRSMTGGACPPIPTSLGTNPDAVVVMLHGCRSPLALKTGAQPGSLVKKLGQQTGPSRFAAAEARDIRASSCDVASTAADQSPLWLLKSFTRPWQSMHFADEVTCRTGYAAGKNMEGRRKEKAKEHCSDASHQVEDNRNEVVCTLWFSMNSAIEVLVQKCKDK